MREAMADLGGDPQKINPLAPAELVIDHSVIADVFGTPESFERNVEIEYERNGERYQFLRWGQGAFSDFKVVPPGTGIVHQVNIEHLARVIFPRQEGDKVDRLPRHLRRHRQPHHDGQRPRRPGLGRRRHRGRGRHARPARLDAHPPRRRLQAHRRAARRRHRHRPRPHDHRDAARARRRREVRRVLRRRRLRRPAGQPRHDRQHEPGVRLHRGDVPDRRGDDHLPRADRPQQGAGRARRGLRQGAGPLARRVPRAGVLRVPRARPRPPIVPSIAGPKRPQDRVAITEAKQAFREALPTYAPDGDSDPDDAAEEGSSVDESVEESFPASDPASPFAHGNGQAGKPHDAVTGNGGAEPGLQADPRGHGGRHRDRGRPRPRRDRRDHLLHQHLQPAGDDRRGAAGQEGRRARADQQAVGEDDAGPRVQGRHGLLREGRAHPVPGEARLLPGRLRLHDLHRQLRPAARAGSARRSTRPTSPSSRCCRATATSRAGSTPTSR